MVNISRMSISGGGRDICSEIADEMGEELKNTWKRTEKENVEAAIGVYKDRSGYRATEIKTGDEDSIDSEIRQLIVESMPESSEEKYFIHTHPGGNPDLSTGDHAATLSDIGESGTEIDGWFILTRPHIMAEDSKESIETLESLLETATKYQDTPKEELSENRRGIVEKKDRYEKRLEVKREEYRNVVSSMRDVGAGEDDLTLSGFILDKNVRKSGMNYKDIIRYYIIIMGTRKAVTHIPIDDVNTKSDREDKEKMMREAVREYGEECIAVIKNYKGD